MTWCRHNENVSSPVGRAAHQLRAVANRESVQVFHVAGFQKFDTQESCPDKFASSIPARMKVDARQGGNLASTTSGALFRW